MQTNNEPDLVRDRGVRFPHHHGCERGIVGAESEMPYCLAFFIYDIGRCLRPLLAKKKGVVPSADAGLSP